MVGKLILDFQERESAQEGEKEREGGSEGEREGGKREGVGGRIEGERERTQNSECFIVEGHLTHTEREREREREGGREREGDGGGLFAGLKGSMII